MASAGLDGYPPVSRKLYRGFKLSIFENYLFAMSRVFLKNLGKKGRGE